MTDQRIPWNPDPVSHENDHVDRGRKYAKEHRVKLADGRIVEFDDFDYQPAFAGSFEEPPEPAAVEVERAYWSRSGAELTTDELDRLHNGDDYERLLAVVNDAMDERRAEDIADGCDECEVRP